MSRRDAKPEPTHFAIYAAHLSLLVARWGIARDELLHGTGVAATDLDDPDARIPDRAMSKLIERALSLTDEPGLGFYYGLHVKLSTHGAVGIAAMTSATLGDTLAITERFFRLRAPHLAFSHHVSGPEIVIEVDEVLPLGQLRVFSIESLFTSLVQMARAMLTDPPHPRIEVSYPEPSHFQGFAHLWPGPVRFERPWNRLVFPASLMQAPLHMADAFASQKAVAECERELARLGETSSLLSSVRRQMMARPAGFPSLTELADRRHVSPRTLKRQLAEHGTSFQQLLDELRRDRAVALLDDESTSIERVAELLGYSDASNFNRAFRRWMGTSPTDFRAGRR